MTGVDIRAARAADVESVLAFWRVAAEGTSVSDDAAGVHGLLARDAAALLLAERDGELAGTVIAGFDGWRCHMYRLAVHPRHRRAGVATTLIGAAEERFRALDGRRADAMVLDRNVGAHGVWGSAGYAAQPQWRRWVRPLRK